MNNKKRIKKKILYLIVNRFTSWLDVMSCEYFCVGGFFFIYSFLPPLNEMVFLILEYFETFGIYIIVY